MAYNWYTADILYLGPLILENK